MAKKKNQKAKAKAQANQDAPVVETTETTTQVPVETEETPAVVPEATAEEGQETPESEEVQTDSSSVDPDSPEETTQEDEPSDETASTEETTPEDSPEDEETTPEDNQPSETEEASDGKPEEDKSDMPPMLVYAKGINSMLYIRAGLTVHKDVPFQPATYGEFYYILKSCYGSVFLVDDKDQGKTIFSVRKTASIDYKRNSDLYKQNAENQEKKKKEVSEKQLKDKMMQELAHQVNVKGIPLAEAKKTIEKKYNLKFNS